MIMDAIANLFIEQQSNVQRYIYDKIHDWHKAEELTADTFCRILVAIRNGNGPKTNELAYMWRTVRMVLIDYYRHKRNYPECDIYDLEDRLEDSAANGIARLEAIAELRKCMLVMSYTMTERQRAVVALRSQGYQWHEIASMLNTNVEAAKSFRFEAMKKLNGVR